VKITFILPGYPWRPVGAYRVVYEYANRLVARGHQVTVVHPRRVKDEQGIWAHRGIYCGIRRRAAEVRNRLFVPSLRWQDVDKRVRMLYVAEPVADSIPDSDAVFATAWDTVQYVCRYPERKGTKFHMVQSYDYWSHLDEQTHAAWRSLVNKVVISKWLCDKMVELGCTEHAYIRNAVNHSKFHVIIPISKRPKRVAMLYSMVECKGSADGLCALAIAKREHPDLQVALFGIPKRPRSLPGWIKYFQNPAPRDLVHNIYNGSSIYLCPSIKEASPLPPAEAMACGCALVTTDCGGTAEYATHGLTALFSPPKSPEGLAKNLSLLLENSDLRVKLAEAGRRRMQELNWENSTSKLLQYIDSKANGPSDINPASGAAIGLARRAQSGSN